MSTHVVCSNKHSCSRLPWVESTEQGKGNPDAHFSAVNAGVPPLARVLQLPPPTNDGITTGRMAVSADGQLPNYDRYGSTGRDTVAHLRSPVQCPGS